MINQNNKDNIVGKLIEGLIRRHPVNPSNTKETGLEVTLKSTSPLYGGHPDFNLED